MHYKKRVKRVICLCLTYLLLILPASVFGQIDALVWVPASLNSPSEIIEKAQIKDIVLTRQAAQQTIEKYKSNYGGIATSLCELGFSLDIVTDITTVNLNNYQAVFGVLGYYPNNHLILNGSVEASAIEAYISNGGNVYLEGGDVWYYDPMFANGHDFGPTFGIIGLNDGAGNGELNFIIGSDIAQNLDFNFTVGADDWTDHLATSGTGVIIHSNANPSFDCGVRNMPLGNTIGVSSSFGDLINGAATRNDLMTAYLNFFGVTGSGCNNQSPVVQFTLSAPEITWGDSVLVDASGTYDPDGDSLTFAWTGSPFITPSNDDIMASIKPLSSGNVPITLTVFDGIVAEQLTQPLVVHPAVENMVIEYAYLDPDWFRDRYYFHGDTLIVAVQNIDSLRIYDLTDHSIMPSQDIYLPDALWVRQLKDNLLYVTFAGNSGFFDPGPLSIYQVGNNWELTALLENYLPGPSDIAEFTFGENSVYVRDFNALYNIDFQTDPGNPQILAQVNFTPPARFYSTRIIGDYLYHIRQESSNKRYIDVRNTNNLQLIGTLNLPQNLVRFDFMENLMFVGFQDTTAVYPEIPQDSLSIYGISDSLTLHYLSTITVEAPVDWFEPLAGAFNYFARGMGNNLLAVHYWGGVNIFDIQDPTAPVSAASWYSGVWGQSSGMEMIYHNNGHYLVTEDIIQSFDNNSGINKVVLGPTGIHANELPVKPNKFQLLPNYPNPFNPSTTIQYWLSDAAKVNITIYNILGQTIKTLEDNQFQSAGKHTVLWDGKNDLGNAVASGIYLYQMKVGNFTKTNKMLLMR